MTNRAWKRSLRVGVALWIAAASARAQSTPDEHASHHPAPPESSDEPTPAGMMEATDAPAPAAGTDEAGGGMMGGKGGGMGGMMDGMMEKMGAPKPRDLYPTLMSLPNLPPEDRDRVRREAHLRMVEGAQLMETAMQAISAGSRRDDFGLMQSAMPDLHEGVARFESGLATNRALADGRAPRNVALHWFKREMHLNPAAGLQAHAGSHKERNHLVLIGLLALFGVMSVVMYVFRLRRTATLLEALSQGNEATEPQGAAPPAQAAGSPPTETTKGPDTSSHPAGALPQLPDPERPVQAPPTFPEMKSASEPVRKWKGRLKVCRIFEEANGVKTLRLAAEDHVALPFTYYPGQFLTLSAKLEGKVVRRSYTIASSPTQGHYAAVTVKREDHGLFSRFLHDVVKEGDAIDVSAPNGKLTFTGTEADSIVLIAGGVGVTPMMSVIRYLTDIGWRKEIFLLFSCRTTSDFMFRAELEQLQQRHANLNVYASMTRSDGAIWMGSKGRFTRETLEHVVPKLAERRVHLCGPPPMMEAVQGMLETLGVPKEQVHTEAFGPPTRPKAPAPVADAAPPAGFQVSFKQSDKQGTPAPGATVLDLADEIGVEIDYSCRTGQCGLCKVRLLSGSVSMPVDDALNEDEKQSGIILACQAEPTTDVEVEA